MICRKCSHQYDDSLGIYGCPNCYGDGLPRLAASNKQRQAELKKRRKEAGLKCKEYWVTDEQDKKISAMLKGT